MSLETLFMQGMSGSRGNGTCRIQNPDIPSGGIRPAGGWRRRPVGSSISPALPTAPDQLFRALGSIEIRLGNLFKSTNVLNPMYLSNPKPGHTFGRGRAGGRLETPAGGRQQQRSFAYCARPIISSSWQHKDPSWKSLQKHEGIKSYVNRLEEHDDRSTSG